MPEDDNILMDKESLIKPIIKTDYGHCKYCNGPLAMLESESVSYLLNSSGSPVSHNVEFYKAEGYCLKCGSTFPMRKVGMNYVPDSRILKILGNIETENEQESTHEENPFAKPIISSIAKGK